MLVIGNAPRRSRTGSVFARETATARTTVRAWTYGDSPALSCWTTIVRELSGNPNSLKSRNSVFRAGVSVFSRPCSPLPPPESPKLGDTVNDASTPAAQKATIHHRAATTSRA